MRSLSNIFSAFMPQNRPVLGEDISAKFLMAMLKKNGVDPEKEVCIIGLRGFYNPQSNSRGLYDDAIFIVGPNGAVRGFTANTDSSTYRERIATLKTGVWLYKVGIHGLSKPKAQQYRALVQAAQVTVLRDGAQYAETRTDTGWFGINIHRGGLTGTSSLGCQTIHPRQWDEFLSEVEKRMKACNQTTIKYILGDVSYEV